MKLKERKGQAMILATLALGGALLGATTIAGLLMLYQIRGTTDSENSAKAIFTADSGVEWALYSFYCSQSDPAKCTAGDAQPYPIFSNGATGDTVCYDSNDQPLADCNDPADAVSAVARGTSLGASRAFFVDFANGAGSLP
jgi:hypothetical protein